MQKIKVSVGIITYNDFSTLPRLIASIIRQSLEKVIIKEVIIVSTEDNRDFIDSQVKEYPQINTYFEPERRGKYSAVNLFFDKAECEILVICSGDIVLEKNAIERLCSPFSDSKIGITASRPIPMCPSDKTFLGRCARFYWELHHKISLNEPKLGEMIAFRNLGIRLPRNWADEEMIAFLIEKKGYKKYYAHDAVAYNSGPIRIKDYIYQRRRNHSAHLHLKREFGHISPTLSFYKCAKEAFRHGLIQKNILLSVFLLWIEVISRTQANIDYHMKKDYSIWKIIEK